MANAQNLSAMRNVVSVLALCHGESKMSALRGPKMLDKRVTRASAGAKLTPNNRCLSP